MAVFKLSTPHDACRIATGLLCGHSDAPSTSVHISLFSPWQQRFSCLLALCFISSPPGCFSDTPISPSAQVSSHQPVSLLRLNLSSPRSTLPSPPPSYTGLLCLLFISIVLAVFTRSTTFTKHPLLLLCFCLLEHRLPKSGHLSVLCTEVSMCLPQSGV